MANQVTIVDAQQRFKKTPAGQIPVDWECRTLGDTAEVRYGLGQPPASDPAGVPIIRATDIKRDKIDGTAVLRVSRDALPLGRKPYLKEGEIIVVRSGVNTGDVALITKEWAGAIAGYDLVVSPSDQIDPAFCFQYLVSSTAQAYFARERQRSAQPHLNAQQVAALQIPLPPLPEQRKIAEILSAEDEAIDKARSVIERSRFLKRALIQEMIGDAAPRAERKVGEVTVSSAFGPRFSSSLYASDGNIATLRTTDIDDEGNISYENMPLAKLDAEDFKAHLLQPGDLVITRSGTCGIAAVFKEHALPTLPGAFLIRFRLSKEVVPEFVKLYFNSPAGRKRTQVLAAGGVQKNLNSESLLSLAIPLPPRKEQERVAHRVAVLEDALRVEQRHMARAQPLRAGLMNQLLMGKVRV